MICMDDKLLLPGQWIDNLNWNALHTVADVEEVMRKVRELVDAVKETKETVSLASTEAVGGRGE